VAEGHEVNRNSIRAAPATVAYNTAVTDAVPAAEETILTSLVQDNFQSLLKKI